MTLAAVMAGASVRRSPMSGWRALGSRLASHRQSQRIGLVLVAELSGLGLGRAMNIELGREKPTDAEIRRIAFAVGLHDASALVEQAQAIRLSEGV